MIAISALQLRDSLITELDILQGTVIAWRYSVNKVYSEKKKASHYNKNKMLQRLKQLKLQICNAEVLSLKSEN